MKKKTRRGSVSEPSLDVLGPLQDLIRQLRSGSRTKEQLVAFNEGRNPFAKRERQNVATFKYDKRKNGWKLREDVEFDGQPFHPDIVGFLKPGESYVNGEVMKQRAIELDAHLGQHHAEYLLEHQELIPKKWRDKYYLVFSGTVWQGRGGYRYVPYLSWDGGRWFLDFGWLDGDWRDDFRLVSFRK